jgi:hypothetical protein
MSEIITTSVGRFRRVTDGNRKWFLWECPRCLQWSNLSEDQLAGKVSVQCGDGVKYCGYHETHNFGAELVATMQARVLMGESPLDAPDGTKEQG